MRHGTTPAAGARPRLPGPGMGQYLPDRLFLGARVEDESDGGKVARESGCRGLYAITPEDADTEVAHRARGLSPGGRCGRRSAIPREITATPPLALAQSRRLAALCKSFRRAFHRERVNQARVRVGRGRRAPRTRRYGWRTRAGRCRMGSSACRYLTPTHHLHAVPRGMARTMSPSGAFSRRPRSRWPYAQPLRPSAEARPNVEACRWLPSAASRWTMRTRPSKRAPTCSR